MNYLALCQRLRQEAEIGGTDPSTVTSQRGQLRRLVDWVNLAYTEIQNRHVSPGWRWMRSTWTVTTSTGDDTYAGTDCTDSRLSATVTRFASWIPFDECGASNVKSYLSSSGVGGEAWLNYLPWSSFRTIYKIGTQNNGQPVHFTIDPQNNLVVGPKPDGSYVLSGEYQMSPQTLSLNGDTPEMPTQFHDLIWIIALGKYGANSVAQELVARSMTEGKAMMRRLEANQLPTLALAGPLA